MDYLQEAINTGDVTAGDITLIQVLQSKEFSKILEMAVNDVKKNKFWSSDNLKNYYWVQRSISGLMIDKGFMPLDKLQQDTNLDATNVLYEVHTLRAFLGLEPNWKEDVFVKKWSRS